MRVDAADGAHGLGENVAAGDDHDHILVLLGVAALDGADGGAVLGDLHQLLGKLVTVVRDDIDDLGMVGAHGDGIHHLAGREDGNGAVQGNVHVVEDDRGDGNDHHVHNEQQRAGCHIGEELFEHQHEEVRAAGGEAAQEQDARAKAQDDATVDGGQHHAAGVQRDDLAKEVDEKGEQRRAQQREDNRADAELAPADDEQRHVQQEVPEADGQGHDGRERRGKAGKAAGRNVIGHGEDGKGKADHGGAGNGKEDIKDEVLRAVAVG